MTQNEFIDNFFKYAGKVQEQDNFLDDFFNDVPEFKTVWLTETQLSRLHTRTAKSGETLKARLIGSIILPYGDENYYITDDGEIITDYFSIGD